VNGVFEAALDVQRFFEERGWRFCIIGGLAVSRLGNVRATLDVDMTLLVEVGREEAIIGEVLSRFAPRIGDAAEFAMRTRVVLIRASNGVSVDIALGGTVFEERAVARATPFEVAPGVRLLTCSAEDLVVLKCFADRPRDWDDVEGILIRQRERLDWSYIREHLRPLCELKEAPEILDRLEALRRRIGRAR